MKSLILRLGLKRYWSDQSAATAIEYGLIVGIIAVAILGISATGGALSTLYESLEDIIAGLGGGGEGEED